VVPRLEAPLVLEVELAALVLALAALVSPLLAAGMSELKTDGIV
jgi:hypothetical protein